MEPTVEIKRIFRGKEYTIGNVFINGKYFCDCLEDPDRDINKNGEFDGSEKKIWGATAIPNGDYFIVFKYSPSFSAKFGGVKMPYIEGLKTHSSVLFHHGNTAKDTNGCILLGLNKVKGMVVNSVETVKRFLITLRPYETKKIKLKVY